MVMDEDVKPGDLYFGEYSTKLVLVLETYSSFGIKTLIISAKGITPGKAGDIWLARGKLYGWKKL